jgi:hypothetical protein
VTKALGGETRVLWLGTNPAAGTQLTIFELPDAQSVLNGMVGGPIATCTVERLMRDEGLCGIRRRKRAKTVYRNGSSQRLGQLASMASTSWFTRSPAAAQVRLGWRQEWCQQVREGRGQPDGAPSRISSGPEAAQAPRRSRQWPLR